jgi:hypothetical protein
MGEDKSMFGTGVDITLLETKGKMLKEVYKKLDGWYLEVVHAGKVNKRQLEAALSRNWKQVNQSSSSPG